MLFPRQISLNKYHFEVEVDYVPSSTAELQALTRIKNTLAGVDLGDFYPASKGVMSNINWYLKNKRLRDTKNGEGRHVAFGKVIFKDSKNASLCCKVVILPEQTKRGRISGNHAPNEVLFYSPAPPSGENLPPSPASMMVNVPLGAITLHSILTTVSTRLNSPFATYCYVDGIDIYRPTLLDGQSLVEGECCHKCRRFDKINQEDGSEKGKCSRDPSHYTCKTCFPKNTPHGECPVCADVCGCNNCAEFKWTRYESLFGTQLGTGVNKVDGTMFDTYFEQISIEAKATGVPVSEELVEKKKLKDDNDKEWRKKMRKKKTVAFNALLKRGDRIKVWWQEDEKYYFGKVVRESR